MEQLTKNQAVATSQEAVQNQNEPQDRKSGSAGMPRPISYAVFCLKKKNNKINTALFMICILFVIYQPPMFTLFPYTTLFRSSYMAVGFYVAKYVNKKSDMDLAAKGLGAKEWNNSLKTKLSLLPKKLFRIRMSR